MTPDEWRVSAEGYMAVGDVVGAVYAMRQLLAFDPSRADIWTGLLFALDLHPFASYPARLKARQTFDRLHIRPHLPPAPPPILDPDPDRPLRVGYVSADYRAHSAAIGFAPIILAAPSARQYITLYSTSTEPDDLMTESFRAAVPRYRVVADLSDDDLAEQIRADRIDILVDLAGYSRGSRLLTFARRPAPIQITGWGHATGTDLSCMDWLVTDRIVMPPHEAKLHRERLLYLPSVIVYPAMAPHEIQGHPITRHGGRVSFGYFGRGLKVSSATLAAWAEILHQVSGSRLILKDSLWEHEISRTRILMVLVSLGISTDRVEFRHRTPLDDYLRSYNDLDVHLDPFPHCGGVTTLDASWMGVPTVTLSGDHAPGRSGASILTTLGVEDLIAQTPNKYVEIACRLAADITTGRRPSSARPALRQRMVGSALLDSYGYADALDTQYRSIWRERVASHQPALGAVS